MRTVNLARVASMALLGVSCCASVNMQAAEQVSRGKQVRILAEAMAGQDCAQRVSGQLYQAHGVQAVNVDMKARVVSVSLPQANVVKLGELWHAVERGNGGPSKLMTAEAVYTLTPPTADNVAAASSRSQRTPVYVVIDDLHCKGCARKIASRLYTLKGVTKVSVDMGKNTLIVQARPAKPLSPWLIIDAVAQANERPVAVIGSHGTLSIQWATKRAPKTHHQAQQPNAGGPRR